VIAVLLGVVKWAVITFIFVMLVSTVLTLMERKQSAWIQNRVGPNRALLFEHRFQGKLSFLNSLSAFVGQIIADAVKVLWKEDFDPPRANKWLHRLAPGLALVPAWLVWLVLPFGPGPPPGTTGPNYFQAADLNAGMLFVFAMTSLSVYAATLGAWASNSAYSLLGGLRTAAQMVSYEVTLGLNLVGIFMVYGSLRVNEIIWAQGEHLGGWLPAWGIVLQPVAFILFMTAAIAETKRAPFDLPEADSELAAGYFTEYSSMRFALFSLSEFIGIVLTAAIAASVFLGGWQIPWVTSPLTSNVDLGWLTVAQVGIYLVKVLFLVWLQMQIRWTLPRFRYDQLMKLGWQYLLPLSILNVAVTAVILYLAR
jgi:NADH-quinone oxidoreductase subunit H